MLSYLLPFLLSFTLVIILTFFVKWLAKKSGAVDYPTEKRKIHKRPIPLLGGLAIFLSFFAIVFLYAYLTNDLVGDNIKLKFIWGIFIAGLLLMIGGFLDDKYNLKPYQQIIWPVLAVIIVIASGIGIKMITNPFGGVFHLDQYQFILFWFEGIPYKITILADVFTFFWLMGMMYTTKFLDGLDGLVSGITAIGSFIIFFFAVFTKFYQPDTALLAIILAGCCLGFLVFNFHPAKIFLGEGGSLFTGFMLGILAIIAGSKIATALLIMGIPILDVAWVIVRRIWYKKSPFKTADKKHLHFRLLDVGFSHRRAVIFLYFLTALFGITTLFLQSKQKLIALGILFLVMIILAAALVWEYKRENEFTK